MSIGVEWGRRVAIVSWLGWEAGWAKGEKKDGEIAPRSKDSTRWHRGREVKGGEPQDFEFLSLRFKPCASRNDVINLERGANAWWLCYRSGVRIPTNKTDGLACVQQFASLSEHATWFFCPVADDRGTAAPTPG